MSAASTATMDDSKPVPIATISGTQPTPESEMDALLLGRTGVSLLDKAAIKYTEQ